jgi:hypothetical protein
LIRSSYDPVFVNRDTGDATMGCGLNVWGEECVQKAAMERAVKALRNGKSRCLDNIPIKLMKTGNIHSGRLLEAHETYLTDRAGIDGVENGTHEKGRLDCK